MDELVRWLGEQLDEDERIARAAGHERTAPTPWRGESWDDAVLDGDGLVDARGNGIAVVKGERVRDHMVRHDPARVLREIAGKRDLLIFAEGIHDYPETFTRGVYARLEETLRLFALAYKERPGYREEWRP